MKNSGHIFPFPVLELEKLWTGIDRNGVNLYGTLKFWRVTRHVPPYWSNFEANVRRWGLPVTGFHGELNLCLQFGCRFRQKSVEWYHMTSPRKENSSVGHQLEKLWLHYLGILKVLTSWAACLGTAVNSVCYTETFRILNACLYQVCSTIKMSEMLLHHDSARPRTSMCPIEAIRESEWTVLLHLPYVLASHFQIFTCLVLWKAACKDTFMWMVRHYGMLCTIGCKGRRETFMK